ncbi:MAG: bifunctional methionine sulfoxide reductase B/A protein [Synergistaceae bacterium]|jgi:peptide methionine sulfoxide reductase msrA/msrB|nr:bifunctional methionine sulfoxide reductase B/A protein [Synergistaceae bacterium]
MPEWKAIRSMPLLGEDERLVLLECATERPNSGVYDKFFEEGLYLCRQCGAPLYRSEAKFDCGCGWPAFDESLPDAVGRRFDPDGSRVEIVCANCSGHLGHVFEGERLTPKNTRHCVNSLSLYHVTSGKALFAGGCFWGVEDFFRRADGVMLALPGYAGGQTQKPTYRDVCGGKTGCVESVLVYFDREATDFRSLVRLFFEIHDPTGIDRQGSDVGPQYRSIVFFFDTDQERIAREAIRSLRAKGVEAATRVEPAHVFHVAEDYHQKYFDKHPEARTHTCHVHRSFDWS